MKVAQLFVVVLKTQKHVLGKEELMHFSIIWQLACSLCVCPTRKHTSFSQTENCLPFPCLGSNMRQGGGGGGGHFMQKKRKQRQRLLFFGRTKNSPHSLFFPEQPFPHISPCSKTHDQRRRRRSLQYLFFFHPPLPSSLNLSFPIFFEAAAAAVAAAVAAAAAAAAAAGWSLTFHS